MESKFTVYVTRMDIDTCVMHETKEFEAELTPDRNKFIVLGKEHLMIEIDMPILYGEGIFVMTLSGNPEYIRSVLLRRELMRMIEDGFEEIGGAFGA